MNRRQALAAAISALVGGLALEGVAAAGGVDPTMVDEASFPAFLEDLDLLIERHRASRTHPLLAEVLERWGLAADHMQAVAMCTLFTSAFRDLPSELQARPEMQERARVFVPRYGALVLSLTLALRRVPAEELRRYSALLRVNPRLGPLLRRRVLRGLEARGVPVERREQFDAVVSRLHFRLGRQDPELLVAELEDRVRRAAAAAGLDEGSWAAAAALATDSAGGSAPLEESEAPVDKALLRFGLITTGIGGLTFLAAIGLDSFVLTSVAGMVALLGGVLVLVALTMMVIRLRDQREAEDDVALSDEDLALLEGLAPLQEASVPG